MASYPSINTSIARIRQSLDLQLPSPLEVLDHPIFAAKARRAKVQLSIKRDDLIHPQVSGNKWRKLYGNLAHALETKVTTLISFGGAYSNHLLALASIANTANLRCVGIIRGDELADSSRWNSQLKYLHATGMQLVFVSRDEYRRRDDADYQAALASEYQDAWVIPEGGSNAQAISGVVCMVQEVMAQCAAQNLPAITHWLLPVGSGGTLAGVMQAVSAVSRQSQEQIGVSHIDDAGNGEKALSQVYGVAVLASADYLKTKILTLSGLDAWPRWTKLLQDFDAGGYARTTPDLRDFVQIFNQQAKLGLRIEPVYSGKLLFGLDALLTKQAFPADSHVCVLHTGGVWQAASESGSLGMTYEG